MKDLSDRPASSAALTVYENPWFYVKKQDNWHWVEPADQTGGAAVLPIVGDKILLLRMNRVSQAGQTLEIPRGSADPGESQAQCALRELREETGFQVTADMITPLGTVRPDTGILRSRVGLFVARIPEGTPQQDPDDEAEGFLMVPVSLMGQLLRDGHIEDGFTLSAIALHAAQWPVGKDKDAAAN